MRSLIFYRATGFSGIGLSYDDGSGQAKTVAHINGNNPDHRGPVILLSLDASAVYAMSQPQVISRILSEGPQTLITTKDIAHTLFEHGMKAALGKHKIGNNNFFASMETYYKVVFGSGDFTVNANPLSLVIQLQGHPPVVVCTNGGQVPIVKEDQKSVDLSRLLDYLKIDFQ
jgi:hypothetical protein